MFSTLIAMIMM